MRGDVFDKVAKFLTGHEGNKRWHGGGRDPLLDVGFEHFALLHGSCPRDFDLECAGGFLPDDADDGAAVFELKHDKFKADGDVGTGVHPRSSRCPAFDPANGFSADATLTSQGWTWLNPIASRAVGVVIGLGEILWLCEAPFVMGPRLAPMLRDLLFQKFHAAGELLHAIDAVFDADPAVETLAL